MSATGWFPVAPAGRVGTTPLPVGAGGRAWVVVRLRPGGEVSAVPARCPHRLVPPAAATVVEGRPQCPDHGWRSDADPAVPWAVEERHGWVWLAPERTAVAVPPAPPPSSGPVLGNLDPALEHAWHPVALARELRPGGWLQVRLLGRTWTLNRGPGGLSADPPAWGVRERLGVVWLAPAQPRDVALDLPEDGDRRFVRRWLPPARAAAPAGPLADLLLDASHAPFVHAEPEDDAVVPAPDVTPEPGGFTAVRVLPGGRRATAVVRVPFQLRLRVDDGSGAAATRLVLLQPEDADSTRVHTCLFLAAPPGRPLPAPDEIAAEAARQERVLAEDLALADLCAAR